MFIEVELLGGHRKATLSIDCIVYFYADNRGCCTVVMDGMVPIETMNSYLVIKKMIENKLAE